MRPTLENYNGGIYINIRQISNLIYADDIVIIAGIPAVLRAESVELRLLPNQSKTNITNIMIADRVNHNRPET